MPWNYRVIRTKDPDGTYAYAVHECYYHNKEDPIPHSWTEQSASLITEDDRESLLIILRWIEDGITKPVLEERDGKLYEVEPATVFTKSVMRKLVVEQ